MGILKVGILYIILCVTIGCSATTQQMVPLPDQSKKIENPEYGRIYVMRPTSFGSANSLKVTDNQKEIGYTGPKGYLCWEREPGSTKVSGYGENTSTVDLTVDRNKVYYIIQSINFGFFSARNTLTLVSEEEGGKTLGGCIPPTIALPEKTKKDDTKEKVMP